MAGLELTIERTLAQAPDLLERYTQETAGLPVTPKGIWLSEMFFFVAATAHLQPRQIVESGRSSGQSTEILARLFPDTQIVSIEYAPDSADAATALGRLRRYTNVAPLFGDARQVMAPLTLAGDVTLIDGPKRFRALRLALTLLRRRQPAAVFLHDYWLGLPERRFLQKAIPEAFCSDDRRFAEAYGSLDKLILAESLAAGRQEWTPGRQKGKPYRSAGPTLACVPFNAERRYGRVLLGSFLAGALARWHGRQGKSSE